MNLTLIEQSKMASELKLFYADPEHKLDFKITDIVKFMADVSGMTSEIIDNIFHDHVLYDPLFKQILLDKLDQSQYKHIIVRSQEMVHVVADNFIKANMVAVLDYLRRSEPFEQSLKDKDLSLPQFTVQQEKMMKVLERQIATMSGEFSEDPIRSLQLYFTRQARIRTLLFQGKT